MKSWMRALVVPLTMLFLAAGWSLPDAVADATCTKYSQWMGSCKVSDDPPPSGSKKKRGVVDYPACSSITGAFKLLPGKIKDEDKKDWRQVICRGSSGALERWWIDGNPLTMIVSPEALARSALAQLDLRGIEIGMVPDDCRGCRGAVGLPIWLWVDNPSRTTWGPASINAGGISLTAEVQKVEWSFGNGDSVLCGKGSVYRDAYGVKDSPSCGYRYSKQGTYTVTATSYWTAQWSGYGQSGTINLTLESTRDNVRIGEIQVLVTSGKRP